MQLSAPLLPFDPCAPLSPDSATLSLLTSDAETTNVRGDFGALLFAQISTVRPDGEPESISAVPVVPVLDPAIAGLVPSIVRGPRPGAMLGLTGDTAVEQNAVSSILATMAVVLPAEAPPIIGELDFTSAPPGTEMPAETNCCPSLPPGGALLEGAPENVRRHHGRRLLDGMTSGKAQAGIRAYGLSLDAAASRKPFASERSVETAETVASVSADSQNVFNAPLVASSQPSTAPVAAPRGRAVDRVAVSASEIASSARPLSSGGAVAVAAVVATEASSVQPMVTGPQSSDTVSAAPGWVSPVEPAELAKTDAALADLSLSPKAGARSQVVIEPSESVSEAHSSVGENPFLAPSSAVTDMFAEKSAAQLARSSQRAEVIGKQTQKISQTNPPQQVTGYDESIGINAAKLESPMASTVPPSPSSPISPERMPFEAAPLSFEKLVSEMAEGTPEHTEPAARRAIESALAFAEQCIPGDQRSVRLKFSVGGEDLAVRVEMRGDKVHTTFHTESPELCSALAREWQSVSAGHTSARSQRMAEPVFASSGSNSNPSLSADSGSAHQRDSAPQQNRATDEFIAFRRAQHQPETAPITSGPTPISLPWSNSGRLHTFA